MNDFSHLDATAQAELVRRKEVKPIARRILDKRLTGAVQRASQRRSRT